MIPIEMGRCGRDVEFLNGDPDWKVRAADREN